MTPFAFDTLSASKQLREAGMEQGVAEAVVTVFQHPTEAVDVGLLATKQDLGALKQDFGALRQDLETFRHATRQEFEAIRAEMATKVDLANLRADLSEMIRLQGWAMMGGTATIVAIVTAIIKLA